MPKVNTDLSLSHTKHDLYYISFQTYFLPALAPRHWALLKGTGGKNAKAQTMIPLWNDSVPVHGGVYPPNVKFPAKCSEEQYL